LAPRPFFIFSVSRISRISRLNAPLLLLMALLTLARHAMATRFEIVLHGADPVTLRAAGEEALAEIERLEAQLSLFRPTSEIAHLNARAAYEPIRVTPALFQLLQHAKTLNTETGGAFDITIAPLMRCWGFIGGTGSVPRADTLANVRSQVGMDLVHLEPKDFSVRFECQGVMLDLGAIGKGYAIDRAAELLREAGIESALLHGGTSTIYALGAPPEADGWQVAIADPKKAPDSPTLYKPAESIETKPELPAIKELHPPEQTGKNRTAFPTAFATVWLKDESLSVSAIWGRSFTADGQTFGHIIDPRTGHPSTAALLSAVILPSATETDALSTALLTLGPEGHEQITALRPGMRTLVVAEGASQLVTKSSGIDL
jgi:thiamine biosynthesis lipoprotein